jgi:hypothetical protein
LQQVIAEIRDRFGCPPIFVDAAGGKAPQIPGETPLAESVECKTGNAALYIDKIAG